MQVVTPTANIKVAGLWAGGNRSAVRALFMTAELEKSVAVDEACKIVHQRIQHHDGKANLYLGDDYFEKITDAEREAFAKGVLLGNYFGLSKNIKVSQKADDEDLN